MKQQSHEHEYEELPDGSADCFECGHKLSRHDWAKRRRERDRQEQGALEIAGAQSCHSPMGQAKTQGVIRRQNAEVSDQRGAGSLH